MTKNKPSTDQIPHLSLKIREALMRGNEEQAILILSKEQKISQDQAIKKIQRYKQQLKDRKVALDIDVLREQQKKETQTEKQKKIIFAIRVSFLLLFLSILVQQLIQ